MTSDLNMDYSKYDFKDSTELYVYLSKKGLSRGTVEEISKLKDEPDWMREFRLRAYEVFLSKPMPNWGGDLSHIDFQNIYYYAKASDKQSKNWEDVPESVRNTFEKLGIPEAERKFLAGVGAQYESEVVYHNLREDLEKQGVIFTDTDTAVKKYPDILKKHFGKVIPPEDNKFAALNSAVWSGGSFIYVPRNVKVDLPLQAYFRINAENIGQFERTLIIADEGAEVHYIEGCTAPVYATESLHSAVVELIAKKGAKIRYTTIQNWSKDVYNLVTKRAYAYEDATVEWIDGNLGSKLTMKYPGVYMLGKRAHAEVLSVAYGLGAFHVVHGGIQRRHDPGRPRAPTRGRAPPPAVRARSRASDHATSPRPSPSSPRGRRAAPRAPARRGPRPGSRDGPSRSPPAPARRWTSPGPRRHRDRRSPPRPPRAFPPVRSPAPAFPTPAPRSAGGRGGQSPPGHAPGSPARRPAARPPRASPACG